MVDPIQFGDILKPLEQRFKKLTPDQQKVYYDRLKYSDASILQDAVNVLTDNAKAFPSPGEMKAAVREAAYNKVKATGSQLKERGCPNCMIGYVHYERPNGDTNAMYVSDCAYCHRGEITIQPQLIQKNDQIYYACERIQDGSTMRYRANPDLQDLFFDATPLNKSEFLKEYHNGGKS